MAMVQRAPFPTGGGSALHQSRGRDAGLVVRIEEPVKGMERTGSPSTEVSSIPETEVEQSATSSADAESDGSESSPEAARTLPLLHLDSKGHLLAVSSPSSEALRLSRRSRLLFLATVTFFASIAGEVQMEAATHSFELLNAQTTALVATCGEFAGCVVFAFMCGGRWMVSPEAEGLLEIAPPSPRRWSQWKLTTLIRGYLPFAMTAFLVCFGTGFANMAVAYVQYPVKVVFKSSKLVPSMAVSVAFGNNRRFKPEDYLAAIILCLGTAAFTSSGAGRTDTSAGLVILGIVMLTIAVLSECVATNAQEWMFRQRQVTPMTLMMRQNFLSLVVCVGLLISSADDPVGLITGLIMSPHAMRLFLLTGACTGASVWANMHLINEAGSVVKEEVSLARRVATVCISYAFFPKAFSWTRQGLGLAFIAIALKLQQRSKARKSRSS